MKTIEEIQAYAKVQNAMFYLGERPFVAVAILMIKETVVLGLN